jgi:hypothetical protein
MLPGEKFMVKRDPGLGKDDRAGQGLPNPATRGVANVV